MYTAATIPLQCPADGLAIFYNTRKFRLVGEPIGHIYLDKEGQKQSQGFLQVKFTFLMRNSMMDRLP